MKNQQGMSPAIKVILFFILILFLIFIGGLSYAVYKLWPLLAASGSIPFVNQSQESLTSSQDQSADKNPLLNDDQEKVLESLGVDPASLPQEITPALEQCLIEKVGAERAAQIKAGSAPTVADFFKARDCL